MSELNTATEPASTVEPSTPTLPAGSGPPAPGNLMQVDRGAFEAYGGDYHAAVRDAKAFKDMGDFGGLVKEMQDANWTIADARAAAQLYQDRQNTDQPAGSFPPAPDTQQIIQANNQALIQGLREEIQTALRQRDTDYYDMTERQRRQAEADTQMQGFRDKQLEALGYKDLKDKDGNMTAGGQLILDGIDAEINRHQFDTRPDNMTPDQERDYYSDGLSEEQMTAVAEKLQGLRDLKYEHAAQVAQEQEDTPSATPGSAPGGAPPEKELRELSDQGQTDKIMEGINIADPDGPVQPGM